ncbi:PPE domain-containing protein [Amycolatopsis sp. NPDC102389]|uniref:PPE domain-containing protein n=1 Tax=Amycolatopsis sp. NPDC102389 TaxID=3363941 RepID=UPI003824E773
MVAEGPLTAFQIYEQITKGEGTGSLSDAQRAAHELTRRHHERAQRLAALAQKTLAGWQGGASMAAVDATVPVVEAAADDVTHLTRAQTAISSQMDAFGTAKNSVKPVPPEQPAPTAEDVKAVMSGGLVGYWSKVQGYQADSQHNIDTFASYHSASTANGDELPAQYAQLTDPGGSVTLDEGGAGKPAARGFGDGSDGREHGVGEPYRGPSGPSGPSTPSGPSGPSAPAPGAAADTGPQPGQEPQPGQHHPGHQQPDDGTRANSYTPPQTTPVVPPAANLDFGPTGKPNPTYNTPGAFPPGYGPGTSGPGVYGPGTGGGRSPGVPGGGFRGGVPGGPGGTGQQPGMGGRSGAGMPGEGVAGRGTAGAAGAAGRGGANGMPMGAGAGRGGKGEEDKEKKAPAYLQNPDPDETFGGYTEKPMPPVIGEKKK